MTRIFVSLAWFAMVMMVATAAIGLSIDKLHTDHSPEMLRWATVHRLAGVATALAVVLVNSIVVTYFIGTSRWCREASEAYGLDPELLVRANRIKRRTFPWAVMGMLAVVGVIALGASADPATGLPNTANWVIPHLIGALAGMAFIGWCFFMEWNNIHANQQMIADVMHEVQQIRAERGLEV
ncbi:MAG: hypothetical protein DWQ37_08295 [Planctomycetota bacterium]|nr:MAG: hypothetical protein DWQ37_08295 [Planctomycetota bacterium]